METGEALISFLDEKGAPQPVERVFVLPPEGQVGPLDINIRKKMNEDSFLYKHYAELQDRTSAYEILSEKIQNTLSEKESATQARTEEKTRKEQEKAEKKEATQQKRMWGTITKSILVPAAREIIKGFFKGGKRK